MTHFDFRLIIVAIYLIWAFFKWLGRLANGAAKPMPPPFPPAGGPVPPPPGFGAAPPGAPYQAQPGQMLAGGPQYPAQPPSAVAQPYASQYPRQSTSPSDYPGYAQYPGQAARPPAFPGQAPQYTPPQPAWPTAPTQMPRTRPAPVPGPPAIPRVAVDTQGANSRTPTIAGDINSPVAGLNGQKLQGDSALETLLKAQRPLVSWIIMQEVLSPPPSRRAR